MDRTLPPRQLAVLRYLATRDRGAARDVTRELRMNRTAAWNTLRLLTAKRLLTADLVTYPISFEVTSKGSAALDAAMREPS
jgi:DNA-binding IclR family transcriptional regulator